MKKQRKNYFSFSSPIAPRLIHPDPDRIFLTQVKDEKTSDDYILLHDCALGYLDRFMAISKAATVQVNHLNAVVFTDQGLMVALGISFTIIGFE
ncbi:MAG: hypothetical protein ABI045_00725 [Flavobacteriales bacterium]